jgi:hypothetical protein
MKWNIFFRRFTRIFLFPILLFFLAIGGLQILSYLPFGEEILRGRLGMEVGIWIEIAIVMCAFYYYCFLLASKFIKSPRILATVFIFLPTIVLYVAFKTHFLIYLGVTLVNVAYYLLHFGSIKIWNRINIKSKS